MKKMDELKEFMEQHSKELGPMPGYISNNSVHDILSNGYDLKGKKILRFADINYFMFYKGSIDIVVFELKEDGKYYVYLEYDEEQQENIAPINSISKMTAKAYEEIQDSVNAKKKEMDAFLEGIYDERLENQVLLVNTFSANK